MFVYNNHNGISHRTHQRSYKGRGKTKPKRNSISGTGVTTSKRSKQIKRKKKGKKKTVRLVQNNIKFLKSLGLKVRRKKKKNKK